MEVLYVFKDEWPWPTFQDHSQIGGKCITGTSCNIFPYIKYRIAKIVPQVHPMEVLKVFRCE